MKTLFPDKFNWPSYLLVGIFLRLLLFSISWNSFFAIMISLYVITLLFDSISSIIPTRHLLGSFMCVQFFIGPAFAYNGIDDYQYFMYKMRVSESEYFLYAIPAVVLFIIGLHINAERYKGEIVDTNQIKLFVSKNKSVAYLFIGIGLLSSILSEFFSSDLAFVFYLLSGFKFIGLFLLILGTDQIKILPLFIVIGSIISSSLGNGMFHDLLTWLIYTISIFAIKYKFSLRIKAIGLFVFMLIVATIQILKASYRQETGLKKEATGFETFAKVYEKKNTENGVFNFHNLAQNNVRINQGFIITNIMITVPDKVPFSEGSEVVSNY
jgi:hypothetical protein